MNRVRIPWFRREMSAGGLGLGVDPLLLALGLLAAGGLLYLVLRHHNNNNSNSPA